MRCARLKRHRAVVWVAAPCAYNLYGRKELFGRQSNPHRIIRCWRRYGLTLIISHDFAAIILQKLATTLNLGLQKILELSAREVHAVIEISAAYNDRNVVAFYAFQEIGNKAGVQTQTSGSCRSTALDYCHDIRRFRFNLDSFG